jgi:SAM-dependent methyltransferase
MILYILIILLLLYILAATGSNEGFENKLNDKFYCALYDHIWDVIPFYTEQIKIMQPYFTTTNNVLCFDSKTGHMPQLLSSMEVVGLDSSKEMIEISKKKYPNIPFIQGDCNPSIFKSNLFTHIYCPLFSINTKDIDLFFECVDKWLVPKGYLFIITYDKSINIRNFIHKEPKYPIKYDIELNNQLIEKISYNNNNKTKIQYLHSSDFQYYKLIDKVEIPNYSCYLNIYQK